MYSKLYKAMPSIRQLPNWQQKRKSYKEAWLRDIMEQPQNRQGEQMIQVRSQDPQLTMWQLNTSDALEEARHRLRGDKWDETSNKWILTDTPTMNEKGVETFLWVISMRISKLSGITDLSEDEIRDMMRDVRFDVIDILDRKCETFSIDEYMKTPILDAVECFVLQGLKRSVDALSLEHIGERTHTVERVEGQAQPKSAVPDLTRKATFLRRR